MQDDEHILESTRGKGGDACTNCWSYKQAWKYSFRNPVVGGGSVNTTPVPVPKPPGIGIELPFGMGQTGVTASGAQAVPKTGSKPSPAPLHPSSVAARQQGRYKCLGQRQ